VFPDVATGVLVDGLGEIDLAIDECLDVGHPALVPSVFLPTLGLVRAIEARLEVYPWVVDDPDRVIELAALGVSGIITDDPAVVATALRSDP
jgi:glycerophosphoryl diester phosphodiesterase